MANESPLQFKGTQLKIIQTLLETTDTGVLHAALSEMTGNSPDFFENELAVLDFSTATDLPDSADWPKICELFRRSGLHAIATRGLPEGLAAAAARVGLPTLAADALGRPRPAKAEPAPPPVEPSEAVAAPAAAAVAVAENPNRRETSPPPRTQTLDKPLRSGQRFYAQGSDLIVTAMVSAGAEVIADGNIHIYAPLRGRALAGASGDASARIFTTCMEAELVSIAGLYRTFEAGVPSDLARQPTTISLIQEGEQARLNVAALALK
jgi:septum site-determining protein MinC